MMIRISALGLVASGLLIAACGSSSSDASGGGAVTDDAGTDAASSMMTTTTTDDAGGGEGTTTLTNPTPDAGTAADSAASLPKACGTTGVTCTKQQRVASHVLLPTQATDYAIDLDGDGKADNQFGSLIGATGIGDTTAQEAEDTAVNAGLVLVLLDESSTDATFTTDPGAATTDLFVGKTMSSPVFSGAGTFMADSSAPAMLQGPIESGVFSSPSAPSVTTAPVLRIGVTVLGSSPIVLPLYVAHVQITNTAGAATSAQINGGYKVSDVTATLIPAMAASLTAQIHDDPTSDSSEAIEGLFDTGGCSDNGVAATAHDQTITACELAKSSMLQSLLAPDVSLFDASGNYHPSTTGTKNAMSVGLSLTLVGATF